MNRKTLYCLSCLWAPRVLLQRRLARPRACCDFSPIWRPTGITTRRATAEARRLRGTPKKSKFWRHDPQEAVQGLVRYQEVKDVDLPPFHETGIFPSPPGTARQCHAFQPSCSALWISCARPAGRGHGMAPDRRVPRGHVIARRTSRLWWTNFILELCDGLERRASNWLFRSHAENAPSVQEKLVLLARCISPAVMKRCGLPAK